MTTRNLSARWLLRTLSITALTVAIGGCGDDSGKADTPTAGKSSSVAGTGTGGAKAGSGGADPAAVAACPGKVYSAVSDGCKTCLCAADPAVAPACQKPCWDFLACSFAAQAGKCATFAAGGDAMRPQFEACTMEECGTELNVPGAEAVRGYRPLIGACAVSMGGAKAACGDDISKIISERK